MKMLRPRALTCQEMVELMTDYLEAGLSKRNARKFERHLSGCDHCTEFLRQIRTTIALTGAVATDELSAQRERELTALFQRWCTDSP
jgi:hypothetical protein